MSNIFKFDEWSSKIYEQAGVNASIINLTITDSFSGLQQNVPAQAEGQSEYVWGSRAGERGMPNADGTGQYLAFKQGEAVMLKHAKGVSVIAKSAGKLTSKGGKKEADGQAYDTWSSTPNGGTLYFTILHNVGDGDSGTGPAIIPADVPSKAYWGKFTTGAKKYGAVFLGTTLLKDMMNDKELSRYSTSDKNIQANIAIVVKMLGIAQSIGIIDEAPSGKSILTQARVKGAASYNA